MMLLISKPPDTSGNCVISTGMWHLIDLNDAKGQQPNDPAAAAAERYVLTIVLPLWMGAAVLDYVLHRRSHIEATSGTFEAALHVGGIALSAIPVLAGLTLEVNAGTLVVLGIGFGLHVGMTVWDVGYADGRRRIVPLEQHVHALLELLPFTAVSLVAVAHRNQALALFGAGGETASFRIMRKRRAASPQLLTTIIGAFVACVALPYAEELVRCIRHKRNAR